MATAPSRSGHLRINGLDLYFEVTGDLDSATPLLLIPGAYMSVDSMSSCAAAFAAERADAMGYSQGGGVVT
jgi:hypothetical protein